jgi:hypothetical protein
MTLPGVSLAGEMWMAGRLLLHRLRRYPPAVCFLFRIPKCANEKSFSTPTFWLSVTVPEMKFL